MTALPRDRCSARPVRTATAAGHAPRARTGDLTGDNTAAVASALQRTGDLITSLAFLLVIVVSAFSASGITFIKLMGAGMTVALVVGATIVRILLVPATMRLLGRANWWAPGPLRRVCRKYGIREEEAAPSQEVEPAQA